MRFLHTSDWQIGKPFGRMPHETASALREARLDAIDALAASARACGAADILVAGDVFDSPEPGDRALHQVLGRIKEDPALRWWLIPGNHDPARADGLWSRFRRSAPPNATVILEPGVVPLGEEAAILAAPLSHRRMAGDPTAWFNSAETPPGVRRIGLAHGSIRNFAGDTAEATNLIAPDRARRAGLSYLALGDWHGQLTVDPYTAYSGTPEADDFGRADTGRALCVTLAAAGSPPDVQAVPTGRYDWQLRAWTIRAAADLGPRWAELGDAHDLKRLVLRLTVEGVMPMAEAVAARDLLGNRLAHEVHWLDLRAGQLIARADEDDFALIDFQGPMRVAADRLRDFAAQGGAQGALAIAALERLFLEHRKIQQGA
ncbi:MAG: DNA repair exonuclease [Alphaproteobacteria bacterium]|nr:DNA repair exonuclease [Alphaproteobacteria bacterium]